jgi:hypothetical protein
MSGATNSVRRALRQLWLLPPMALLGCQTTPEEVEQRLAEAEPAALRSAQERGRVDLNCGEVKGRVLSREAGDQRSAYSLQRMAYRIETQGCRKRTTFVVACTPKGVCSALSENGLVERE